MPKTKASLNELQIRHLEQFKEHADQMEPLGYLTFMYPRSGYRYSYDQRQNLSTITSLVKKGLLEKEEHHNGSPSYSITQAGREALAHAKAQVDAKPDQESEKI